MSHNLLYDNKVALILLGDLHVHSLKWVVVDKHGRAALDSANLSECERVFYAHLMPEAICLTFLIPWVVDVDTVSFPGTFDPSALSIIL